MTSSVNDSSNVQAAFASNSSSEDNRAGNRDAQVFTTQDAPEIDSPSSTGSQRSEQSIQRHRTQAAAALGGGSDREDQVLTTWIRPTNNSAQSSTSSERSETSIQRHRTRAALTLQGNDSWYYISTGARLIAEPTAYVLPEPTREPKKPSFLQTISNKFNGGGKSELLSNITISAPRMDGDEPLAAQIALPIKEAQQLRLQDPSILQQDAAGLQRRRELVQRQHASLVPIDQANSLRTADPEEVRASDSKIFRERTQSITPSVVFNSHPPSLHNSAGEELPNTFYRIPIDQTKIANRPPLPPSPEPEKPEPKTVKRKVVGHPDRCTTLSLFINASPISSEKSLVRQSSPPAMERNPDESDRPTLVTKPETPPSRPVFPTISTPPREVDGVGPCFSRYNYILDPAIDALSMEAHVAKLELEAQDAWNVLLIARDVQREMVERGDVSGAGDEGKVVNVAVKMYFGEGGAEEREIGVAVTKEGPERGVVYGVAGPSFTAMGNLMGKDKKVN